VALGEALRGILTSLANQQAAKSGIPTLEERAATARQIQMQAIARRRAEAELEKLTGETAAAPETRAVDLELKRAQAKNYAEPNQRPLTPEELAQRRAQAEQALAAAGLARKQTEHPELFHPVREPREPQPRNPVAVNIGGEDVMIDPVTRQPIAGLKPPMGATARGEVANLEQVGESIQMMRKALPQAGTVSRTPGLGSVTRGVRTFTGSSGPEADFDFAANRAQQIIYALSGKQINEAERAQLLKLVPNLAHGQATEREMQRFEDYLNVLIAAKRGGRPFSAPGGSTSGGLSAEEEAVLAGLSKR